MKDAFDRPFRNGGTDTLAQSQAQQQEAQAQREEDEGQEHASGDRPSTGTLQAPSGQRAPPDVRMPPPSESGLSSSARDKGKGRAIDPDEGEISSPSPPATLTGVVPRSTKTRPREESPPWDIELDLTTPSPPPARQAPKRAREESPTWDIELDLNPSDVDIDEPGEGREAKRRR